MTIPILKPGESLPPEATLAYLTARGGHYLMKRGLFFEAVVKVPEIPTLEELKESYRFTGPRIPAHLFASALAFFQAAQGKFRTEAAVLLAFEQGKWDLVIPRQEVTGTSVKYGVPKGRRLAGSIHSHPGMSGRFSTTDERDEAEFDGIHIVVGDSGFVRPEISCAAVVSGRRIDLDPRDILEGWEAEAAFPEEWLAQLSPPPRQELFAWAEEPATPEPDLPGSADPCPLCGSEVPEVGP